MGQFLGFPTGRIFHLDFPLPECFDTFIYQFVPSLDPPMAHKNDTVIKFTAPGDLKEEVQELAAERHLSLAAFIRLILTEYLKNKG